MLARKNVHCVEPFPFCSGTLLSRTAGGTSELCRPSSCWRTSSELCAGWPFDGCLDFNWLAAAAGVLLGRCASIGRFRPLFIPASCHVPEGCRGDGASLHVRTDVPHPAACRSYCSLGKPPDIEPKNGKCEETVARENRTALLLARCLTLKVDV